ncbi:iron uptake transporter permease EfeU [Streptantibioticus silvisoli]|uniref:FTR1 family protein n=1 Tax=Streptantibioticus silvisoli TaxID=2705255 RepID=A0ABT6W9J9_9ACTN|nr:iron uptake transporter permease EfeU [Streptantibioticus silvisoli]MDI5967436.1 FTR1 family protein [Streptantibioticus silvisoli]
MPNLLIGLREGLEAGLVVSILLAALRKTGEADRRISSSPVWLGVVGAMAVSGSFAAVLTFSTSVLSSSAQEAVGGLLSVLAVGLVTGMVFWMRRTAASLSGDLRSKVGAASRIGPGALAVTAFLAVGREGLETTLFLWTAVRASGETVAPLAGAGVGLAVAILLCRLLYARAIKLNLGVFFSRTALALIVIAAGVLSYGLGDLQDAGLLPGRAWVAFDVSGTIATDSWWASIITGITDLSPLMTVLQLVAWAVYLAVVVPAFLRAGRTKPEPVPAARPVGAAGAAAAAGPAAAAGTAAAAGSTVAQPESAAAAAPPAAEPPATAPDSAEPQRPAATDSAESQRPAATDSAEPPRPAATDSAEPRPAPPAGADSAPRREWAWLSGRSPWTVAVVLIVVPAAAAAACVVALPSASARAATQVSVTASSCAGEWKSGHTGAQTFAIDNKSGKAGEINLDNAAGAIVGEIETLGPATTAQLTATLTDGTYTFKCLMSGSRTTQSGAVQVSGRAAGGGPAAVAPVTVAQLQPAAAAYHAYVRPQLDDLTHQVAVLRADLDRHKGKGDLAAARTDWLTAQLTWDRIGAAYDSFGDLGADVDGLPDGLPGGVHDRDFTGLHRLEYGLWHGQSAATLRPVAARLTSDLGKLKVQLPKLTIDPTDLPIRAHEILEDALRDRLSGMADFGSGAAYPETYADLQGTRVVVGELQPLITARAPHLIGTLDPQLDALNAALLATRDHGHWRSPQQTPQAAREKVAATVDAALETLSAVPDLLEVPISR